MSGTVGATIVLIILILAALVAWVAWLGMRNGSGQRRQNDIVDSNLLWLLLLDHSNANSTDDSLRLMRLMRLVRQYVGAYYARHQHTHEYAPVSHDHDERHALTGHDHDTRYSHIEHTHDDRYATLNHSHQEYVTRNDLNRRTAWLERQLVILSVAVTQSPVGMLLGSLFGGLIGAITGFVLDLTLPRSVFEIHATTTYTVGGRQIVQQLTSYDAWPKWGIPLGCAVAGMILGGLTLWLVGMIRDRRQSTTEITEA